MSAVPAPSIPMDDLLLDAIVGGLAGVWTLTRVIEGMDATLTGTASLRPDVANELAYRETGCLVLADGRSIEAHRRYRFRRGAGALAIDFADGPDAGRSFVSLVFAGAPERADALALHACGEDTYTMRFTLRLPAVFETLVTVAGPRKAYRIASRYDRQIDRRSVDRPTLSKPLSMT